jgi:hypothetical protein
MNITVLRDGTLFSLAKYNVVGKTAVSIFKVHDFFFYRNDENFELLQNAGSHYETTEGRT